MGKPTDILKNDCPIIVHHRIMKVILKSLELHLILHCNKHHLYLNQFIWH